MKTLWHISLIANSIAISLSFLFGLLYASLKLKYTQDQEGQKKNDNYLNWYDYIIIFILVSIGAFIPYFIVYKLSGYLPMGKFTHGLLIK